MEDRILLMYENIHTQVRETTGGSKRGKKESQGAITAHPLPNDAI